VKAPLLACIALLAFAQPAVAAPVAPATHTHVQLARFGGGFRGTGRGFGTRPRYGYRGYRRNRGRGIFRSIIRALAVGYLLHLLFTTPGGNLLLLLMIAGVVLLVMRVRRRSRMLRY
jgi:Flp pilus assembly protein TadB